MNMIALPSLGRRAVIIGGSIAGMLAARALSPHFEEVVIVERDGLTDPLAPRATAPQSSHLHVLIKGGENAIERMLPGFIATLESAGSVQMNSGLDLKYVTELGVLPRFDSKLILHGQSRWMLEHCLRSVVRAQVANLRWCSGMTASGLLYDAARHRVTGVKLEGGEPLEADLVIDAAGRNEMGLRHLRALGLPLPEIEEVHCELAYGSVTIELAPDAQRDWKALSTVCIPNIGTRGGMITPIENGLHICSLWGRAGDYPPGDVEGFMAFAKALPHQVLYNELERSRFVTRISRMGFPANRFRHDERHAALPAGLLPIGDTLCSFNPTYGQGMSSAALQAEVMCEVFAARSADTELDTLARRYIECAATTAQRPWRQANFNDFLFPTTRGDRTMFSEEEMHYRVCIQQAALTDAVILDLICQVNYLLIPFERMLEDDVRERISAAGVGFREPDSARQARALRAQAG